MCCDYNKTEAIKAVTSLGWITPLSLMQEAAGPGGPMISPQVQGQSREEEDGQPAGLIGGSAAYFQQQGCGQASRWPPFSLVSQGTVGPPEDQVTGFLASAPTPPAHLHMGQPSPEMLAASCTRPSTPWRPGPALWGPGRHLLARPSRLLPSSWLLSTSPSVQRHPVCVLALAGNGWQRTGWFPS